MNQVLLIGRVGEDPRLSEPTSAEGKAWAHLMLATHDLAEGGGEKTTWHRVTCWGDQARAVVEHVRRGMTVAVRGRLMYRVFRVGSQRRWAANIEAQQVEFMDRAGAEGMPVIPEGGGEVDP